MDFNSYLDKITNLANTAKESSIIDQEYYNIYDVKRGLRNNNGTGVLVGLTKIGEVWGYHVENGKKIPVDGKLYYRGIDVEEIVDGFQEDHRFGFEEVCFLLLFGVLPSSEDLKNFKELIAEVRELPYGFVEDMILKAPSKDIMNKLMRSILVAYSYDKDPDDTSVKNVLRQSIELTARVPSMVAYGYQSKSHYYDHNSLYIHAPQPELSIAENILYMIRPDNVYTAKEAELLDLAMVLHAEHGGGNNSAFATHVVTSTGTDTYSAIAAAVGSLKGPKHGGANIKVMQMMDYIKGNLKNWEDTNGIKDILEKILKKEAFDGSGLIYGMGHAIYTKSDPRAQMLREKAKELAIEKQRIEEYNLYRNIEKISVQIFQEQRNRVITANVDFYSGFVYDMLNIPSELYTPIFAAARIPGWCAHRIEQLVSEPKIIRPAYKSVSTKAQYVPIEKRERVF